MKEAEFQQQIIEVAKLRQWKVAHFRGVRIPRRDGSVYYATPVQADGEGWPDLVMLRDGRVIIAEIKSDKGVVSDAQTAWLREWEMADAEVFIWRPKDWDELVEVLK